MEGMEFFNLEGIFAIGNKTMLNKFLLKKLHVLHVLRGLKSPWFKTKDKLLPQTGKVFIISRAVGAFQSRFEPFRDNYALHRRKQRYFRDFFLKELLGFVV